jgi:hypothetical protein
MHLLSKFVILTCLCGSVTCSAALNLIPWPQSVVTNGGSITISSGRIMYSDAQLADTAAAFSNNLSMVHRFSIPVVQSSTPAANDIYLTFTTNAAITGEVYTLTVDTYAALEADEADTIALGGMTIIQAIEQSGNDLVLPCMTINDYPYRKSRMLMIDIKNQWHSVDDLKQFIKLCQFYKVRHLSLHTGEQQWIGAVCDQVADMTANEKAYKRFYTKAEMDEIIAFGAERGVYLIPHNECTPHYQNMIDSMRVDYCAGDSFAGFPDELDGQGFFDFNGTTNERWFSVMKIATERSIDQFAAAYPDGILPYYHIGPVYGEGGMNSATAKEIVEIVLDKSPQTIVGFWNGISSGDANLSPYKDNIAVFYYQQWGGANIYGYLDNGWNIINAAWSPLYLLGSVQRTQNQIYDNWNYYRSGDDGYDNGFKWEAINWFDFDNPAYYDQVLGGCMCTWEMTQTDNFHFDKLRPRLPIYADLAWYHQSPKDFHDISNRFLVTDAMLSRFIMDTAPPTVPTSVAATDGIYSNKIMVSWKASENNPENYIIYRNTVNNSGTAPIIASNGTATAYEDVSVSTGQDYYYWIKAINYFGESALSDGAHGRLGTGVTLPLAYDGFDYTAGESIDGKNGGEGWNNAWDITSVNGTITIKSNGLQYSTLPVNGNCINVVPATETPSVGLRRDLIDQYGLDATPLWIGFLVRGNTVGVGHFFLVPNEFNLAPGKRWGNAFAFNNNSSPKTMQQGETHFVVAKYECRAGSDDAYLWIDPPLGSEPSTANSDVSRSDSNLGTARRLDFNIQGYGFGDYDIDELRVASSWDKLISLGTARTNPPAPPTGLTASQGVYPDKIAVAWSNSDTATKYAVYRYIANDSSSSTKISGDLAGTSYDDTNVAFSMEYFYWVKAGNDNDWSDFSDFASGYLIPEPAMGLIGIIGLLLLRCR